LIYSTIDPDLVPVEISPPETAFRFGGSLALDGDRLLIGAWGGATGSTGAAYLYQRDSLGTWHYKAKLAVPGLPVQARYGRAVALAGEEAHVSALTDSTDGANMGGIYRFGLSGITTEAVLTVSFPDPAPYNGQPRPVQYAITPDTLPVTVSYNGSVFAPTNAGTYPVTVTLNAPGYAPQTVSGSIVITKADDGIVFGTVPVLDAQDGSFVLGMTTASGRVPALTSATPGVLTVSQLPPRLNPQSVGTSVVTATLPESQNFTAVESALTVIVDDLRAVGRPPVVTPVLPAAVVTGLDQLGVRVAVGGEYAAAARRKVPGAPRAVSVFRRLRNGQWLHFAELPLPASPNNQYGQQLAVGGNVIAVGDASWANRVHLYEITPTGVTGPVSVAGGVQVSEMGWRPIALSEDGGFLFCSVKRGTSDPSGVRVYRRPNSPGQWPLHQTIVQGAADAVGTYFGAALAARGELVAVSAPQLNSGLVFTYRRNPATSLFQSVNAVINESAFPSFGSRLDLDGDRLLVTHPFYNGYGDGREGRVMIYKLDEGIPNSPINISTPVDVISAPAGAMAFGREAVFIGGRIAVKRLDGVSGNQVLAYHRRNGAVWEILPAPALGDVTSYLDETTLASSAGGTLMVGVPRGENAGAPAGSGRVVFLTLGNETLITQGITPNFTGGSTLTSVATFGSVIACGVDFHQENARFNQGKVFLFDASTGMEVPVQSLLAATPRANGLFGRALALGGTHLAVAHFNGVVGGEVPVQVEIFRRGSGVDFVPVQTLTLSDTVPSGSVLMRMALNDAPGFRTLVIGLPGAQAVHLFSFNEVSGQWQFLQRIGDTSLGKFGDSVAIHGENVVIGGPGTSSSDVGRVDRYRRNSGTGMWDFVQSLPIVDPAGTFSSFHSRNVGRSVAIGGDWIAVGSNQGTTLNTRVHFHSYQAVTAATHHSSVAGSDQFGAAMAAAGPYLMIGSPDANGMSGRAALYFREPFGWREIGRIEGTPGQTAFLGQTLAVGSRFAVAGHRIQPGTRDSALRMLPLASPSFAQWTQAFQLAGSLADPNGDPTGEGVPNLLRHVFGIPANAPLSAADLAKFPAIVRGSDGVAKLVFSLPMVAEDVALMIEKASGFVGAWQAIARRDDGDWKFSPGTEGAVERGAGGVDIDISLDDLADPKCFYRLKVVMTP
jgi:hypothetical protein